MFKKFLLYASRWQLSGLVLAPCIIFIENPILATIIANSMGACLFFWVDKFILQYNKEEKKNK